MNTGEFGPGPRTTRVLGPGPNPPHASSPSPWWRKQLAHQGTICFLRASRCWIKPQATACVLAAHGETELRRPPPPQEEPAPTPDPSPPVTKQPQHPSKPDCINIYTSRRESKGKGRWRRSRRPPLSPHGLSRCSHGSRFSLPRGPQPSCERKARRACSFSMSSSPESDSSFSVKTSMVKPSLVTHRQHRAYGPALKRAAACVLQP